ncbi:MAG TPA: DHA2 family efflux MFS transporter permease subunit [Methyloceanibacter sp.]|jgi:DHA2 family multidrug resistance protein|nr:DHA2 family efflux MFS transporter permease subunit [Methyloceanibacter sp.]
MTSPKRGGGKGRKGKQSGAEPPPPEPPRRIIVDSHPERAPIPLVVAVVLTAVLEVLDMTIVNVAIPHMLGAFGATPDQITWVLTSYIVAAAVVMPLTGYLSTWLGRRRLLLTAIIGFIISSALCGMAWNLESMVIFRLAQGVFGAPLVPLSQGIILDAFPRERHGQALAIFGLGIMVAPVIGPTLGGYLTETYSWRTVFYINVPIGLFALLLSIGYLPKRAIKDIKTDWVGMALLVIAVGALQFVLDQGQMRDWFNSRSIVAGTIIAVFTTAAFFLRGWNKPDNIIDLSLLRDRNFVAGTLAITAYGISLFGWMALMPLFSQRLLGYPPDVAGTLFIPRAIVSAITLAITGSILIKIFDARYLVTAGLVMTALGTLLMSHFTLYVDYWGIATPGIWSGIGTGLFFVPLTAVAFASIPNKQYDEASGVYALMRGIGGSAGIAIVSWLFVRQTQIHFNELTAHITPFNRNLAPYLSQHGLTPYSPEAAPLVAYDIARQAQMLAFNDLFWFIGIVTLAIIPLIFLMKKPEKVALVPAA